jgi:hypothetical protein
MKALGIVLAIVLVVIACILFVARGRRAPDSPRAAYERAATKRFASLRDLPIFEQKLGGLPEAEMRQAVHELAVKGMLRLGDAALLERTVLLSGTLAGLDEATCGAIVAGRYTAEQQERAIASLPPAAIASWLDLDVEAARAELLDTPEPPVDPRAVQDALIALFQRVPQADRERLRDGLVGLRQVKPEEACWVGRTIYAQAAVLGEPHDKVVARMLARP